MLIQLLLIDLALRLSYSFHSNSKKMKKVFKFIAAGGLVFALASCGTANDAYGNNYPNQYPQGNGGTYRTPDGNVYRQGDIYRDRNGNVYQNGRVIRTGDVRSRPGVVSRNGNNNVYYPNRTAKRLPPGQAKKVYGGSAKVYAPGQVKKGNQAYKNGTWRKDGPAKGKKHDHHNKHSKGKHRK